MAAFEFDRPRAVLVFRHLAAQWRSRQGVFGLPRFVPPEQRYLPPSTAIGSREHALFLFFFAFLNRSGKTVEELGRKARAIAAHHPWIIDPLDPRSLDRLDYEMLADLIPFAHLEKYRDRIDWWFNAMTTLRQDYGSDPRNLFLGIELSGDWRLDRDALLTRVTQFHGNGRKIAQLTLLFFQEVDWPEDRENWARIRQIPAVAADIWVMRLMRQLDLIVYWETDLATVLSPAVSDFICQVCYEEGISHTDLIQALWHIGAVVCGRMRPRGQTAGRSFCHGSCPACDSCVGIVPANYIANRDIPRYQQNGHSQRTTQRLANLRYDEIVPHAMTFDDIWKNQESINS
jgi:hypothetical protein